METIKENPYKYVCEYAESLYPGAGKKVFQILALMPCSLIMPPIPRGEKTLRNNISALFLGLPGTGKSSLSNLYSRLTYNYINPKSITPTALMMELQSRQNVSIIVDDFAQMARDVEIVKILEGAIGEEKRISRTTARSEYDAEVNCVALLCGVPADLHQYMGNGLIFRLVPIFLVHNEESISKIGEHIANNIGKTQEVKSDEIIKAYYEELAQIQADAHPKIKRVEAYYFNPEYVNKAKKEWDDIVKDISTSTPGFAWIREFEEFFRFLCSHAFLNVFNRKIEKGVLYPNEQDFKVALFLMKQSIKFKWKLITRDSFARTLRNNKEFQEAMTEIKDAEDRAIVSYLRQIGRKKTRF